MTWRNAQQACLHLRRPKAATHADAFLTDHHRALVAANRLQYKMTPRTFLLEDALLSGFIKKEEQTGYPAQKPASLIAKLLKMAAKPGDLIVDVTGGSGTTAVAAIQHGCPVIISDRAAASHRTMKTRLGGLILGSDAPIPRPLR